MSIKIDTPSSGSGSGGTVDTTKLPLTGGTMSGPIGFDSVGTQNIAKGSFDSSRGGYNGISLNCAVGYELNWQAGWLKAVDQSGNKVAVNSDSSINVEYGDSRSVIENTDIYCTQVNTGTNPAAYGALYNGGIEVGDSNGQWAELTPTHLRFADSSTQTTAGLPLTGGTMAQNSTVVFPKIDQYDTTYSATISGSDITITDSQNPASATLNSNGISWGSGYTSYDSGIFSEFFTTTNDSGSYATISSYNGIKLYGNASSITFDDGSVMTTAPEGTASGLYLPLDGGGTITGNGSIVVQGFDETSTTITPSSINGIISNGESSFTLNNNGLAVHVNGDSGNINLNLNGISFLKYDMQDKTWSFTENGLLFADGTTQTSAAHPIVSAGNSGISQSGNMSHSDYSKELQIVYNGVTYAIPARIV